jgi:hypothetical protein
MGKHKRLDLIFEKHFGIGLRWDNWQYPVHLSLALPFFTITLGLGKANF